MTSVFEYRNYKTYLEAVLKSESSQRGIQSAMARYLGCQAAYLYQVLKGKAELTEDQAFKTTLFLKFNEEEREYFFCLVRYAKASSLELRRFLEKEVERKIQNHKDLKNRVDAPRPHEDNEFWDYYFSSIIPSSVHMLTSSKKYQNIKNLAQKLFLSEEEILFHLHRLHERKLVHFDGKIWTYANSSIHFPKDSKFNHQMQKSRRIQCLSVLNQSLQDENVHFSSLFTLDGESLEKLRSLIGDFVQNAHGIIHQGGMDEMYILNLDLFAPKSSGL